MLISYTLKLVRLVHLSPSGWVGHIKDRLDCLPKLQRLRLSSDYISLNVLKCKNRLDATNNTYLYSLLK